jgi:hypothetical protein
MVTGVGKYQPKYLEFFRGRMIVTGVTNQGLSQYRSTLQLHHLSSLARQFNCTYSVITLKKLGL